MSPQEGITVNNPLRDPRDRRLPRIAGSCGLVMFGVTGDLARKKLMPAVYDLANRGLLPPAFALTHAGTDMRSLAHTDSHGNIWLPRPPLPAPPGKPTLPLPVRFAETAPHREPGMESLHAARAGSSTAGTWTNPPRYARTTATAGSPATAVPSALLAGCGAARRPVWALTTQYHPARQRRLPKTSCAHLAAKLIA